MNIQEYLVRINYKENPSPNIITLKKLQKAHLLNIPFENLDIHYKNRIELDPEKFFHKIVLNRRGGFCYELNGLFYQLLKSLGFNVKMVSARVYNGEGKYSQEYDHMTLIVTIDGMDFISDVGFGDFLIGPLAIDSNAIQQDESGNYQVDKTDDETYRISKVDNDQYIPEFIFKNTPVELQEFSAMCHFHQTSSESHFTQRKLISIPTEKGRITLTSDKLKIKQNGEVIEIPVRNDEEFKKYLLECFHVNL